MVIRIPVQTITVGRDGKNIVPTIGQPFNFTAEEIEQIESSNPAAVRNPVVEAAVRPVVEAEPVVEQVEAKATKGGNQAAQAEAEL